MECAEKTVVVASFDELSLACIARSKLNAAGITCFLTNEYLVGVHYLYVAAVHGMDLIVLESDAAVAHELLAGSLSRCDLTPEDKMLAPDLENALFEPETFCPRCGSSDVAQYSLRRMLVVVSYLFFGIPLASRKAVCRCRVCARKWRE